MRIKKTILLLMLLTCIGNIHSQNLKAVEVSENGHVSFVDFSAALEISASTSTFFTEVVKAEKGVSFKMQKSKTRSDARRFEHYKQYYNGILVDGGGYTFHYSGDEPTYAHGKYVPVGNLITVPALSEKDAERCFSEYERVPIDSISDSSVSLLIKEIESEPKLVYRVVLQGKAGNIDEMGYVNAHSGKIEKVEPLKIDYSSTGTFTTLYNGTKTSTTDYYLYNGTNAYHLYDSSRNIHTWNLSGSSNISLRTELSDNDNVWTSAEHSYNNNIMALDVHWALQQIYDRLYNVHGINSLDDAGHEITAYIRDSEKDNACWHRYTESLYFGEGEYEFSPLAAVDAVGHEFGHGMTQFNIGWGYSLLEQAFNEGLSDIWGAIFDYYIRNVTSGAWTIGEQITNYHSCLRNIKTPSDATAKTQIADTYSAALLNEPNYYITSGVLSHWFYLLTNGGSGTNGLGSTYKVYGVGMNTAEQLIVEAVFGGHLLNTTTFDDLRLAFYEAAQSLGNSFLSQQVLNAWYAVGVGSRPTQMAISGPGDPFGTNVYSVSHLPSGCSVTWSFSGSGGLIPLAQSHIPDEAELTIISDSIDLDDPILEGELEILQNTPQTNMCTTIYNSGLVALSGTLKAKVKRNNVQIATLTIPLSYTPYIIGTFSQEDRFNVVPIWDIAATDFYNGQVIDCNVKSLITLTSNRFTSAPSHTGATLTSWTYSNGTVQLMFPYSANNAQTLTISGTYYGSQYEFYLYARPANSLLLQTGYQNGMLTFDLENNEQAGIGTSKTSASEGIEVSIVNVMTGREYYHSDTSIGQHVLSTAGWKKGVYLVRVKAGDNTITKQVLVE